MCRSSLRLIKKQGCGTGLESQLKQEDGKFEASTGYTAFQIKAIEVAQTACRTDSSATKRHVQPGATPSLGLNMGVCICNVRAVKWKAEAGEWKLEGQLVLSAQTSRRK